MPEYIKVVAVQGFRNVEEDPQTDQMDIMYIFPTSQEYGVLSVVAPVNELDAAALTAALATAELTTTPP